MRIRSAVFGLGLAAAAWSCGGGSSSNGNSNPTAPSTNHNPTITFMSVTPSSGMSQITTFEYAATATDPDGDPLTYSWTLAGALAGNGAPVIATNASGTVVIQQSGTGTVQVTVSDGKSGSATASRPLTLGTVTGDWNNFNVGPFCSIFAFTNGLDMRLTQTGTSVSGLNIDTLQEIPIGSILPARPGVVTGAGHVTFQVATLVGGNVNNIFDAWNFVGDLDSTFQRMTFTITDVGPNFSGGGTSCTVTVMKQ